MTKKDIRNGCITIFLLFAIIWISLLLDNYLKQKEKKEPITPPVEEINTVDSLLKENHKIDSIIIKLDSIKNEKIKEVKDYNNDSTLELFKELVSE